jgi:hypothetical protein
MANDLPSDVSKKGGDEKPTNDNPANNGDNDRARDVEPLTPAHPNFDRSKLLGLCGDVVGILFLWACLLESHNVYSLIIYFFALFIAYGAACYLIFENVKRFRWVSSVLIFVVLNGLTSGIVWKNSRPPPTESKAYPFIFSLNTADQPNAKIELTNDFLFTTNFGKTNVSFVSIIMPKQARQTDCILQLVISNSSTSTDGEIAISLPPDWECIPDFGWIGVMGFSVSSTINPQGKNEMVELQTWAYRFSGFLLGDSIKLPDIKISKMPKEGIGRIISLFVKTKDLPPECLGFNLCFITASTNIPLFHKPFLVRSVPNSNGWSTILPSQLKELQK